MLPEICLLYYYLAVCYKARLLEIRKAKPARAGGLRHRADSNYGTIILEYNAVVAMPISKEKKALYPSDWADIALTIKIKAGWKCEECDRPCRKPGETLDEFKYRLAQINKTLYMECCRKPGAFVLTVAHLNHKPSDVSPGNLKAYCAPCHLRYDATHHAKNRKATIAKKKAEPQPVAPKTKTKKTKIKPATTTKSKLRTK